MIRADRTGDDTETVAFALRLKQGPGAQAEYLRRHDALWPQMRDALLDAGVVEYEIHLEPGTGLLFAWMRRDKHHRLDDLPKTDVWRRWQAHMSDLLIMEGEGPLETPLHPMFSLAAPKSAP